MTHVSILQSGVLAQQFCARVAHARVEAVFARSFYLRAGDSFVCIGAPDIGSGPFTLIADFESLPAFRLGQIAVVCDRHITIGDTVRFALDQSEAWCTPAWPVCPPPAEMTGTAALLATRTAIDAPEEGLARHLPDSLLGRAARARITRFESALSDVLDARHGAALGDAVRGLIGLGPGLTPSGDDFLSGALATLDAAGESDAHVALARAISDALPGATSALSATFLQAAAARHIGEKLHRMVAAAITGDIEAALAAAANIGHSSGWDMLAGITSTLRVVAATRVITRYAAAS